MNNRIRWFSIICLILCSLGWTWISFSFDAFRDSGAVPNTKRPFLLFFALAALGSLGYMLALAQTIFRPHEFRIKEVLGVALFCRLLLLPSIPIQEIDLYRYLWDGSVVNQGINPYRYAPEQIKQAIAKRSSQIHSDAPPLPGDLPHLAAEQPEVTNSEITTLAALCREQPEVQRILNIVHFSELPTVYPPVSQALFALSVATTPRQASRYARLFVLKFWLLLFDIATILGILALLKQLSIPGSWAIVYGWSPLVLKEFANSGHLDAITIAFSVWAVVLLVRAASLRDNLPANSQTRRNVMFPLLFSSLLFACSIAGKLYPVILLPVALVFLYRRLGVRSTGLWLATTLLASFLFLSPWIFADYAREPVTEQQSQQETDSAAGLQAFMTRWQINDWLFSIVHENILPDSQRNSPAPWFVITPDRWREAAADAIEVTPFLLSRLITFAGWGLILVYLLVGLWHKPTSKQFVHQIFLTLAWFWLLAPTQNPWYWAWALPFLLPTHRVAWLGMSCVLFAYYVRFPLLYFETDGLVPGTSMSAWALFSDVIVWLEFAPLMLWILFYKKTASSIDSHSARD